MFIDGTQVHLQEVHRNIYGLTRSVNVCFCRNDLPESSFKYQLLGLNLLCLLAQNRVAEFHTELELLPPKEIQVSSNSKRNNLRSIGQ